MLQFYFLSVFLNAFVGYLLFFEGNDVFELKNIFQGSETFTLVLGILSALTGLLKLLSPVEGDMPVMGDIVPAVTGFICGFILLFEFYNRRSSLENSEQTEKINRVFIGNKKIIGAAAIIVAVLHFLFPRVLLL